MPVANKTPQKRMATLQEATALASPLPEPALFTPYRPMLFSKPGNNMPPDERKVKLGKSTLFLVSVHLG